MRAIEKKAGLILGGILLFSLVLVGVVFAAESATTATVTVNEFLSVTLTSGSPITFGGLNPGDINKKPTNDPLVATIGPETNVGNIFVKTKANAANFGGAGTLAVNNLEWATTTGAFPGNDYLITDATVCSTLGASDTCNIFHELDIPNAQAAGAYSVGITVTATTAA